MRLVRTFVFVGLAVAVTAVCANLAFTAANTVAASKVGQQTSAISVASKAPLLCRTNGVVATTLRVTGAGSHTGTSGADLIVRGANATANVSMTGGGGKDCIVAGSVNAGRRITMTPATGSGSVCIKGPGPGTYTYGAGCAVRG
jgi:hypothetical protein